MVEHVARQVSRRLVLIVQRVTDDVADRLADLAIAKQFGAELHVNLERAAEARLAADAVQQAIVTELRTQVAAMTTDLATTTAALLEARTSVGQAQAALELERAAMVVSDEELKLRDVLADHLTARLNAVKLASLGVVSVVFRDLIIRESDRARKAQGSQRIR
jgi:hypothetical protein